MEVCIQKEAGCVVAALSGELDHHAAGEAREKLILAAREGGVVRFVLDLTHLGFMDSSGVGVILSLHKTVSALGGQVVLVPGERSRKLLEVSGLTHFLPVRGCVEDAKRGVEV